MRAWSYPDFEKIPGDGAVPAIYDSATGHLVTPNSEAGELGLYVCGITPYDATHLGHAFTYLAFDTLQRAWIDAGITPKYVQNITDVDDPLLERANATGVDWIDLARSQIELFRSDMSALSVLPPQNYVAVTEVIELIADAVEALLTSGFAYRVDDEAGSQSDIYFDSTSASAKTAWTLGEICGLEYDDMLRLSAERGGDPERPGKRHPLDPCLWRARRPNEPFWPSNLGEGRPGWHVECSAIAVKHLGTQFAVQGGGVDLLFPHHEFSAAHATAITGHPLAHIYAHAGLVAYEGEKMSKSRGNLVFVSRLLEGDLDPSALRLALLSHHYRSSWEWRDEMAAQATAVLQSWRDIAGRQGSLREHPAQRSSAVAIDRMRALLADDLNTPAVIDELGHAFDDPNADLEMLKQAANSLLGIKI